MTQTLYIHTRDDETGNEAITVVVPGIGVKSADDSNPNFASILEAVKRNDPDVLDLFDIESVVARNFERLGDRVTVANGTIFLDGDPVDNALTDTVIAFLNEGVDNWKPLVKFFEKVQANPNEHSRNMLYDWMRADPTFTITSEGMIIGYKGVKRDSDGSLKSVRSGPGIVNGQEVDGHLDNSVGNVVEMARSSVQHDPSVGCSVGLHVGTWSYASGWSKGAILKVLVDPRDVVSVPTDCSAQKMRVCRYTVLDVTETRINSAYTDDYDFGDQDDDDWDDEFDYDEPSLDDTDPPILGFLFFN